MNRKFALICLLTVLIIIMIIVFILRYNKSQGKLMFDSQTNNQIDDNATFKMTDDGIYIVYNDKNEVVYEGDDLENAYIYRDNPDFNPQIPKF